MDARAIEFVCENKTIHYTASEVPMICDLESEFLYYPKKFSVYGGLYNDFKEGYVNRFK
ncbi:hypothetical protein [Fusibacter sp. 3D3]|uniref:hypothetical protein n=1 Tax=Fusibacter sp. 3D3 TaxID=1048380 RepID=UPI000857768D|nr:hypothetical protein [Fusibacter sp. 3D3]GAU78389.1 hypothetical protein F3D3_3022 [Fusibacter sp. 3D3]